MTFSAEQLTKWSARGDPIHAWYSYQMIREKLYSAQLGELDYVVYPQGSYANKTNIGADSDVDLVIALRSAFYPDKEELGALDRVAYERYYQQSDLTWQRFREIVIDALRPWYSVQEKSKCVKVRSNLIRLPADVLIALDHRHYTSFISPLEQTYIDGVQFYAADDAKIINFPKAHVRACYAMDKAVGGRYRPVVRIAKNVRNRVISGGVAPSYFLESLLWNVPKECFAGDPAEAYRSAVGWLYQNKEEKKLKTLKFPNGMARLFGEAEDAVWTISAAQALIGALYSS